MGSEACTAFYENVCSNFSWVPSEELLQQLLADALQVGSKTADINKFSSETKYHCAQQS